MIDRFVEIKLKDWTEVPLLANMLSNFIFRGQGDSSWELSTAIERTFQKFEPKVSIYENKEYWIIREFRRKFHLYSNNPPDDNNFEWLAILQHYGCPTRLLDFTYSLYIALFFAINDADSDAAVWGVNLSALAERTRQKFSLRYKPFNAYADVINSYHITIANKYIANQEGVEKSNFVISAVPTKFTERISVQQGIFLIPLNLQNSFIKNLYATFKNSKIVIEELVQKDLDSLFLKRDTRTKNQEIYVIKIVIPKSLHNQGIEDLTRMNITNERLFPGLDGLAKSFVQTIIRN